MVNLLSNLGFSDPREKFDRDDRTARGGYVDAREMLQGSRVLVLRRALDALPGDSEDVQHMAVADAFKPSTVQLKTVEVVPSNTPEVQTDSDPLSVAYAEAMTSAEMRDSRFTDLTNENFGIAS